MTAVAAGSMLCGMPPASFRVVLGTGRENAEPTRRVRQLTSVSGAGGIPHPHGHLTTGDPGAADRVSWDMFGCSGAWPGGSSVTCLWFENI